MALANTLPGPIATKMAAYIGYKVKGDLGAIVAIITHVLPSIIALISIIGNPLYISRVTNCRRYGSRCDSDHWVYAGGNGLSFFRKRS